MRAIVITQKDRFFIPKNIEMLILSSSVEIISIYLVNSTGSLTNKKMMFVKGFGFFQSLKMFLKIISNELLNLLDSITFYKVFDKRKSLSSLSKKYRCLFCDRFPGILKGMDCGGTGKGRCSINSRLEI